MLTFLPFCFYALYENDDNPCSSIYRDNMLLLNAHWSRPRMQAVINALLEPIEKTMRKGRIG